jgi:DNA polymerase III delta prime subunit
VKNESLNHIDAIESLLLTIRASEKMHALIIEGPPGWGKTTAVEDALKAAGVAGVHLGSYSTPLHLFNFLHENSRTIIVIDDCAGLFSDQSSMAILKAATWGQGKKRKIRWGSTSGKASAEEFQFEGKLIIVCNSFPATADAEAVKSRSFPYRINIDPTNAKSLLEKAAGNPSLYSDTQKAVEVAKFLCKKLCAASVHQISYRTLQMGYELAQHNGNQWQTLLERMVVSAPEDPKKLVRQLSRRGLAVKDQIRLFEEATGLKRRTFFKYRREIGASRV